MNQKYIKPTGIPDFGSFILGLDYTSQLLFPPDPDDILPDISLVLEKGLAMITANSISVYIKYSDWLRSPNGSRGLVGAWLYMYALDQIKRARAKIDDIHPLSAEKKKAAISAKACKQIKRWEKVGEAFARAMRTDAYLSSVLDAAELAESMGTLPAGTREAAVMLAVKQKTRRL